LLIFLNTKAEFPVRSGIVFIFFLMVGNPNVYGLSGKSQLLREYKTDGCTGYRDGNSRVSWRQCCEIHDLYYWGGGQKKLRQQIDKDLFNCVKEVAGSNVARIIYSGVRIGSISPIKFPGKQWSNAWGEKVVYSSHSPETIRLLRESLLKQRLFDRDVIKSFVKTLDEFSHF
jgi:hypothetical protein